MLDSLSDFGKVKLIGFDFLTRETGSLPVKRSGFNRFFCLPLSVEPGSARKGRQKVAKRFLDDLPDLWPDEYSRRRGIIRRKSTSAKSYSYEPEFVDCPQVRHKLVDALLDGGIRRKWQAALIRIFQENRSYDKQWANDPNNPFPMGWLKGGLPHVIKRNQFDKLSQEDYFLWLRIVKERTGLNDMQGSDKAVKIFDKMQEQYLKGHRTFYIWETEKESKLVSDENLLCCILGIYHDNVCGIAKKIVTDEIRDIDADTYKNLVNFAGQKNQAELETLLAYAENKDLLKSDIESRKDIHATGGTVVLSVVKTPETDQSLIYQANAETFYDIPKSTLSKASKKKPGEVGYLWSGHKGRRVFYRKEDCERLSRSRKRLR